MILPFTLLAYLLFHDYPCCNSGEFVGKLTTVSLHGFEMAYNVLTSITWLCWSNFILTSPNMTCVMIIYLGTFLYTKILPQHIIIWTIKSTSQYQIYVFNFVSQSAKFNLSCSSFLSYLICPWHLKFSESYIQCHFWCC